jgi:hypothetical protein
MDVQIRAFIYSFCSMFFPDDICSLNFMPNKIKLIVAILLIPLILTILYRKIISNHDHFEHFRNSKKNRCCRRIPIIINNNHARAINNPNIDIVKIPNKKIANMQINNTACSKYDIDNNKINYLYRKNDKSHKYLGSRCLNTYSISKKLMKKYKDGKNMFHSNYLLFDKV